MIRGLLIVAALVVIAGAGAFWSLTVPQAFPAQELPDHKPDLANGKLVFTVSGCGSCHAAADADGNGGGDAELVLAGGGVLDTPFGKFFAPNISPDPEHGIGAWTLAEFVTAMKFGVDPQGRHLYPAFPYASYQRMRVEDIIDLKAYLDTLPPVASDAPPHELPFPYNFRRGLGLWKLFYVDGRTFAHDPAASDTVNRGAYLVTGPGHCGECHSPRNIFGGVIAARAFSGGPAPEGRGSVPNITPDAETGIGDWSENDIVDAFVTGFTPEFDTFGGSMVAVQKNIARLPREDIEAIAAYLKSLPPIHAEAER